MKWREHQKARSPENSPTADQLPEHRWEKFTPIRRGLKSSGWKDRILIFIFVFVASTILSAILFIYMVAQSEMDPDHVAYFFYEMQGNQARMAFIWISLLGGVLGVIAYAVISIADPYGTESAERQEAKRQREREEMLSELRQHKFPNGTEFEQAIKRLAELDRQEAQAEAERKVESNPEENARRG